MKGPGKSEVLDVFPEIDFEEIKDCSISDVISFLKSSFRADVFVKVESMLRLREGKLVTEKEEMERNLKELELEFQEKRESLEELESYRSRCVELEERNRKAEVDLEKSTREAEERYVLLVKKLGEMESVKLAIEEELEKYRRTCQKLKELITRLEEDHKLMCEKEQRHEEMIASLKETNKKEKEVHEKFIQLKVENRDLESGKQRAENEMEDYKRRCRELEARVLQLEGENLVLRGTAQEKMTVESIEFLDVVCSEEKGKKEPCNSVRSQNGANDGKGSSDSMLLAHMKFEGKMLNSGEIIHASADVGCARHSPVREKGVIHVADPPFISVPSEPFIHVQVDSIADCLVTKEGNGSRVRKQVSPKDGSSDGRVAPTVVRGTELVSGREVVLIVDSDDEMEAIPASNFNVECIEKTQVPSKCLSGKALDNQMERSLQKSSKRKYSDQGSESAALENDSSCKESFTPSFTTKRKHSSKVITSDDESEEDDNIPICKRKWKKLAELCDSTEKPSKSPMNQSCAALSFSSGSDCVEESITTPRRHLVPLRQCEETKCGTKRTSVDYLAGQKLSPRTGNLILGTIETSYRMPEKTASKNVKEDEVEDAESDGEDEGLGGFIVRMRRGKESSKWEYEADMLSSFSKDPVLCMRAVCAIYRRQTSEEKSVQGSSYVKNRGFNKFDVLKGSDLAEYLMDGDLHGPLIKSVEELEKHEPGAVEYCSHLASHYSRQLFEIYQNKEDCFFP
ncbi:uncharacterized protein LOC131245070 isoform X2 [Magnolia sinica]|uniref:uncharacterized protein LOC131245070 isoform X2 n=1 Tax=Magnolia sinica TaxID=86752 RepID=UPI00265B5AF8|nr:uncharacterized protein LOC131245070 isoform X2 [Magnolia sinica]